MVKVSKGSGFWLCVVCFLFLFFSLFYFLLTYSVFILDVARRVEGDVERGLMAWDCRKTYGESEVNGRKKI